MEINPNKNSNEASESSDQKDKGLFPNSRRFNPEDYVTLLEIGRGNYSSIYLVEDKTTKTLYAMKIYLKSRVESLRKKGEVLMEKHVLEKSPRTSM